MSCSEWSKKKIENVCLIKRGASPRPIIDYIADTGIPWVKISDATASNSRYIDRTEEYIKEDGKKKSRFIEKGTLILSNSATPGIPKIMGIDACVHDGWLIVSEFKDITKEFMYYTFINERERLLNLSNGSVFRNLKTDIVKNYEINLPPIEEQIKITGILSSLDKKIELNNEINKTLEEIAQALFKRWFVDFEFPNEDGEPYKSSGGEMVESELGIIPKGWKYGVFNDISEKIYSGGTPKTSEENYWNGELPWMSSGETRNNFVTYTEKSITSLGAEKSSTKLANKYDTVIASAGQGFTRGQTSLLLIDSYVNQSLIVVKSNEIFKLFTYINIKMRYNELRAVSDSHSIRGSLTTKMISDLATIIPSKEILLKFNKIVKPLIVKIENNINNSNGLIELRDSLLPKLMSGEIKVEDIEANL